jgi:hypothetical protein
MQGGNLESLMVLPRVPNWTVEFAKYDWRHEVDHTSHKDIGAVKPAPSKVDLEIKVSA